jgi:hypothetical protein
MTEADGTRIADPTIRTVFDEFLAEQRKRLSDRTYRRYEDAIDFFRMSMDGYAYQWLDRGDKALFHRYADAEGDDHLEFTEIFGPDRILENVDEFLGYFMPHKVLAGKQVLRTAGTVTKKIARWLRERGYASPQEAEHARQSGAAAARDLPAADDLLRLLSEHTEAQPGSTARSEAHEDHFEFTRVEPEGIWVRTLDGTEIGPIRLPPDIAARCRKGWAFSGRVARQRSAWRMDDVWKVYPGP